MRRTLRPVLVAALVALVALALLITPASASVADPSDTIVLAAAEGEEPVGPDPQPREAEGNAARELAGYEDKDTPFTWGAAWLLSALGLGGLAVLLGLYRLLVKRPERESAKSR